MKTVRLKENTVAEIIPAYALPVEKWYGAAFAAQCVEAPDEVKERWVYDPDAGTFAEPTPESETPSPPTTEERFTALEAGNSALIAKLNASIQSSQFLEDCLVEMAEIVYA